METTRPSNGRSSTSPEPSAQKVNRRKRLPPQDSPRRDSTAGGEEPLFGSDPIRRKRFTARAPRPSASHYRLLCDSLGHGASASAYAAIRPPERRARTGMGPVQEG